MLVIILVVNGTIFYQELPYFLSDWDSSDKDSLTNKCISVLKKEMDLEVYNKTPIDVQDFCICSTDIIQDKYSKAEYLDFVNNPSDTSSLIITKMLVPCLTQYESVRELFLRRYNDTPTTAK